MDQSLESSGNLIRRESFELPFKYFGDWKEYFKIWIVNILLTLVTFGLYSAWAKVRKRKYLYGALSLDDSRFEYTAQPVQILKGRILVAVVVGLYALITKFYPTFGFSYPVLFVALFPWVIVTAMNFNLNHTLYKNMSFGFKKCYEESYWLYFKATLITVFTLGLGFPYSQYLHKKFVIDNSRYGDKYFETSISSSSFYKMYIISIGVFILGFVAVTLITVGTKFFASKMISVGFAVISMYIVYFIVFAFTRAYLYNLVIQRTQIHGIKMKATMTTFDLCKLYFQNIFVCVFTLGLAIPWAVIRTMKYKADNTLLLLDSENSLNEFISTQKESAHALGDSAIDFWDIDLGF